MPDSTSERGRLRYLLAVTAFLFAAVLVYSQTHSFSWDEGFHLLAAQLIMAGKRPYIDFCFPQTPLNAYLTADYMKIFGQTWRSVHVLESIYVAAAAFLTADYIRRRFPVPNWRTAASLAAAVAVAFQSQVVIFGTIGQSYGLCLFLVVAAYRLAVWAVETRGPLPAAAAGLAAGAAAASSLLTAPAGPVLFLWIALRNRAGNRWAKIVAYALGACVAFLPVLRLYRLGPQQTLFNLFQYQTKYRHNWNGATDQDITALTSWVDSAQGMSLALLAVAGLWYIWRRSEWKREQRSEFYLSAWVALAISAELAFAHPTFERYFLLIVPFVVIPAIAGLYAVGAPLSGQERPLRAAVVLIVIFFLSLTRALYQDTNSYSWQDLEAISKKVAEVSPPNATIWADELIYFVMRRPPPDGMEFAYAHEIEEMPADQAAKLHIITASELRRRTAAGDFQTVAACYDTDNTDAAKVPDLYNQKATVKDCTIYWDFKR